MLITHMPKVLCLSKDSKTSRSNPFFFFFFFFFFLNDTTVFWIKINYRECARTRKYRIGSNCREYRRLVIHDCQDFREFRDSREIRNCRNFLDILDRSIYSRRFRKLSLSVKSFIKLTNKYRLMNPVCRWLGNGHPVCDSVVSSIL